MTSNKCHAQQQQQQQNAPSLVWYIIKVFAADNDVEPAFTVSLQREQPAFQQHQIPGDVAQGIPANQVVPQPLPANCINAERVFMTQYVDRAISALNQLAVEFPYEQTVHWSINLGDNREYNFHLRLTPQ